MAIRPVDLSLDNDGIRELTRMQARIDQSLKQSFDQRSDQPSQAPGSQTSITFASSPVPATIDAIVANYTALGWDVQVMTAELLTFIFAPTSQASRA